MPGDKWQLALGAQIHHPEIARLQQKLAVIDIALQFVEFR